MTSNSSKALPYFGIAVGVAITLLTLFGYGDQTDKAITALQTITPILGPSTVGVALGGLVNKALEVKRELGQANSLEAIKQVVADELAKAKTE